MLCNFIEITLRHGYSPENLLHIFRKSFYKNTSGGLLLYEFTVTLEKDCPISLLEAYAKFKSRAKPLRNSSSQMFFIMGALKDFFKFDRKTAVLESFFNKLQP